MNYEELTATISELADALSGVAPDRSWSTVRHFVDHGEPEEAIDLMIAVIVKLPVPLTRDEHDRVRALMEHYDFSPADRSLYRYLADSEMLDRMTVVDEPSA